MPSNFASYTETSVNALKYNPKSQEVIDRKQEILKTITEYHGGAPASVLFYGFNPLILITPYKQVSVTEISEGAKKYLDAKNIKYTYIDESELATHKQQFDWVIAADEYFTFAETESVQIGKIEETVRLAKKAVITTLRDYKNLDFRDREFSQPMAVHNNNNTKLFVEYHHWELSDKNAWTSTVYELDGADAVVYGPFARRTMFFKQMAKFSLDAGARNFYVHKNLMYKSVIKKNYEHVISINL